MFLYQSKALLYALKNILCTVQRFAIFGVSLKRSMKGKPFITRNHIIIHSTTMCFLSILISVYNTLLQSWSINEIGILNFSHISFRTTLLCINNSFIPVVKKLGVLFVATCSFNETKFCVIRKNETVTKNHEFEVSSILLLCLFY